MRGPNFFSIQIDFHFEISVITGSHASAPQNREGPDLEALPPPGI